MSDAENRVEAAELAEWVRYLKDIGVRELSVAATAQAPEQVEVPNAEPAPSLAAERAVAQTTLPTLQIGGETPADLEEIRTRLGNCTRCKLHEKRTNIVFGVGNPRARLLFVGEGPGADEDIQGAESSLQSLRWTASASCYGPCSFGLGRRKPHESSSFTALSPCARIPREEKKGIFKSRITEDPI